MTDSIPRQTKVFYGWYIVGSCLLIMLYTGGVVHFGFTAVIEPIADEFGWSYAQISLAASLRGLEIGLLAPVMGLIVDRLGPRKLIFVGSIFLSGGFLLLSNVSSLAMFYVAFALIAIGMSTNSATVTMTAVGHWFRRRVGIATGIVSSGVGLGGFLVPVVTLLIDYWKWRNAMLAVAVGMIIIILPLSLLIRHRPEEYGYKPDGDVSMMAENGFQRSPTGAEISWSAKEVLSSKTFWTMAFAAMLFMLVSSAFITHVMPYFSSLGISRSSSSLVALALPVMTIIGRIGGGWISDRTNRKFIFVLSFAFIGVSLFLFEYVTPTTMLLVVPSVIMFSLGWGSFATARISFQRELFGRGSFGTILGFISGVMMIGMVAGAPLVGWVFDTQGSYQYTWLGCGVISLIGMFCAMTIPSAKNVT